MSPVSRVRKRVSEPEPQSVNGLFKDILKDFASVGTEPDPLEVELLTSEVTGQWWDFPLEEDESPLGLELIGFASRKITPGAAALLAALKVLGETEEEREEAAAALETVLGRGIPAPDWADTLGQVTLGECIASRDVYGDETSLLCTFSYGEAKHGVLALLDFTDGGRVRDVVVVDAPDEVLADMRKQAAEDSDLVTIVDVEPARAHQLLADGFATTDAIEEPDVSEDFARFRSLALVRLRAFPQAAESPELLELTDEARDEVVAEFLAAEHEVEDNEATRAVARLLVDYGCEYEPVNPLRVGPEKLARFLESLLDGEFELDEEYEPVLGDVLLAWAGWGADRAGVPDAAKLALLSAVADYLEEFGQDEDSAADVYLDGTEEFDSAEEIAETIERRMFAIPSVYTEIGDEELELEPTDPEQRRLLVIGEHPEYHEALAAEEFDGEPRMQLALKTAVVDQLWDNEPAEVWEAASRLSESGAERDDVLERLTEVLAKQLQPAGTDELAFDLDEYRKALSQM
ncbi:hypothetical protein AB5J62_00050 [Amycolatopsis sp. cg5]|uniref:hypothetical protein n=1 Tax=Amycolatopsis sp. cg5 TaxID=3238802 RepID=UPI00352503B3